MNIAELTDILLLVVLVLAALWLALDIIRRVA